MYIVIIIYIYIHIHTLHYITLHYSTLHYTTLHYISITPPDMGWSENRISFQQIIITVLENCYFWVSPIWGSLIDVTMVITSICWDMGPLVSWLYHHLVHWNCTPKHGKCIHQLSLISINISIYIHYCPLVNRSKQLE